LLEHTRNDRRVFVGFDFCFGYPGGYAAALGLRGDAPPWRLLWDELSHLICDTSTNENNRFAVANELNMRCGGATPGPFWGHPVGVYLRNIPQTSPTFPYQLSSGAALARFRRTEQWARGVQPAWKLYGSGSVGGQTLLGIPAVSRLRDDPTLASISQVWPFETGFTATPTPDAGSCIICAEIYPGLLPKDVIDQTLPIRDQAQVRAMVRWLADLDAAGNLGKFFAVPDGLLPEAQTLCVREEGWILGADKDKEWRLRRKKKDHEQQRSTTDA
jgi:precorrin-8X/cobalt-precorrin-8 methylmutase